MGELGSLVGLLLCGMWGLSCFTRDQARAYIGAAGHGGRPSESVFARDRMRGFDILEALTVFSASVCVCIFHLGSSLPIKFYFVMVNMKKIQNL